MIAVLVMMYRVALRPGLVESARRQAARGLRGHRAGTQGLSALAA